MALDRSEIAKDIVQQTAEAALSTGGALASIAFDASRQTVGQIGSFLTEVFEIVEASRRAAEDASPAGPG